MVIEKKETKDVKSERNQVSDEGQGEREDGHGERARDGDRETQMELGGKSAALVRRVCED